MSTIYLIIYGLRSCQDCDEIKGYVTSQEEAKAICKTLNAINDKPSYIYEWQDVNHLKAN